MQLKFKDLTADDIEYRVNTVKGVLFFSIRMPDVI